MHWGGRMREPRLWRIASAAAMEVAPMPVETRRRDPRGAELLAEARELQADLVRWRRHLHAHPELSYQERETAAYIAGELEAMGVRATRPIPNAVVADLGDGASASSGSPFAPGRLLSEATGPIVALRADIDALPIQEETGLPFASTRPGAMHACGHDGHTAILLGVARLLRTLAPSARVRLIFQPAEEVPPGGAEPLIALGVLDGVAAIAGLHLWSPLPSGRAVVCSGPAWAAADRFRAVIRGRGGHGALPHLSVDAVEIACRAVSALQSIVSRKLDPLQPGVVTVGMLQAGRAFNIIADPASMEGTVRAFDEGARAMIQAEIERVLHHTAAAAGAAVELDYIRGYPPLVNDPGVAEVVRAAAGGVLGEDAVRRGPQEMAADDFARYAEVVPACYLTLGAGGSAGTPAHPHHHPRFDIDESVLPSGVAILAETALALLARAGKA